MKINFTLNRKPVTIDVPPHITLLALLRDYLNLTGTKEGCGIGECGACSVLLDGRVINSCLILAPEVQNREVVTIEGVHMPDGSPSDLQLAFVDHGAVQCGYCTPGMIIAAEALLMRNPNPTRDQIRTAIAGNLCRCTGYIQIIDAIEAIARKRNNRPKETDKETGS